MPDDIVLIVARGTRGRAARRSRWRSCGPSPCCCASGARARGPRSSGPWSAAGTDLGAFRIVGEMGSTQAIKQAVKAGVGVSLLSRRAVDEECRAGTVWCLRVAGLQIDRAFYLVTHRERSRSPLAEAFRAFVEAEAS